MNIIVTGGAGFLGSHVMEEFKKCHNNTACIRSKDYDLVRFDNTMSLYKDLNPDIVVHLAAVVGGIGANRENPGRFFYENMAMGLNLIEGARIHKIKRFVFVSTVCAYPKFTPTPFKEESMWDGYPEETNAPYGIAKKSIMVMLQGYRDQYGLSGAVLVPTNLYGPRDHFDPSISHVIPALIKKFVDAKNNGEDKVKVWGDGSATREFLYVTDAARAIVKASLAINNPEPINLGSGYEISIKDLAKTIGDLVGFSGEIVFETNRPNGQPRRLLDTSRAARLLEWKAEMDFNSGLKATIDWYMQQATEISGQ